MVSPRTRYGTTYGVPLTTSSRVPGTRPARPKAGWMASRSTLVAIRSTVRTAASGSSRAMYSASSSRLLSARLSHLTRTAPPLSLQRLDFFFTGEVTRVSFFERCSDLRDLPFVQLDVGADRLGGDIGLGALHRLGEFFKPALRLAVNPDRHYFRHVRIVLYTSAYIKPGAGSKHTKSLR